MKTLTIIFTVFIYTLSQNLIHAQNFSESEKSALWDTKPMRWSPYLHPVFEGHLDKVGNSSSERKGFRGRDRFPLPLNQAYPFHNLIQEQMPLPEFTPGGRSRMDRASDFFNQTVTPLLQTMQSPSNGVQEAWVRHYASGLFPSFDVATAMAVDALGNVYVTGSSPSLPFGVDYFTAKYDASGAQVWEVRYNGEGNGDDLASAILVDASGSVYVTGWSSGSGTGYDFTTVKYNSFGRQEWVARYNGPGSSNDIAIAIAIDGSGNVYVTGRSWGLETYYDYSTVKYNPSGAQEWVARYNGPGNNDDEATSIAIDGSGNIYVTGKSRDTGTGYDYDYATVKYNPSGAQEWVARYNGPGNGYNDAKAIAVDGSGYVYVTGSSEGSGTNSDYATVKYNSSGVQVWVARYDGSQSSNDVAKAIAIDGSGNVYVTGESEYDYATVKYNPSGTQEWVAQYNGPENGRDYAAAITVDGSGNVYVTGESWAGTNYDYATVKYNPSGAQEWVARYDGTGYNDRAAAIAIDGSGNVYVTGESWGSGILPTAFDYATVKYNSSGIQVWVARYDGPGSSGDAAKAIAIDGSGNVYVTGNSCDIYGALTGNDYATVKYNPSGTQEWVARYNGPGNQDDEAAAIAIDGSGNVYVTGSSEGSGTSSDYATIKYNPSGTQEWEAGYNGPGNDDDEATAIAIDGSGNIYVTGKSRNSETGYDYDYATVKYNPSGVQEWVARYIGTGNSNDEAAGLAVDGSGNVYVTGWSVDWNSETRFDYATVKYNPSGAQEWVARYDGTGGNDRAAAIAIDGSGNVYVTGSSEGSGTHSDYTTVKYNLSGIQEWVARYNGPGNGWDSAEAIAVDGFGNVYVTGNYATVKYNSFGIQEWVRGDAAKAIVVDSSGNVYVTGESEGPGMEQKDYATIKYNSSGVQEWIARYNGPENGWDIAEAIAVDGSGNVYVTGYSEGFLPWSIYTTIKYVQASVLVREEKPDIPIVYWFAQNYPNPFNASTTIQYALPKSGYVTLKMFNISGQEIETLVSGKQLAGEYEIQWNPGNLPSGLYVYRLQAGEFVKSKKLVLLK